MLAKAKAEAEGLQAMLSIADPEMVRFYLALKHGLFTDMAGEHALRRCTTACLHGIPSLFSGFGVLQHAPGCLLISQACQHACSCNFNVVPRISCHFASML